MPAKNSSTKSSRKPAKKAAGKAPAKAAKKAAGESARKAPAKVASKVGKKSADKAAKKVAEKSAPRPQSTPSGKAEVPADVRHQMIEKAAYYLAEKRGFQGDDALADWLASEKQVNVALSRGSH